MWKDADQPMKSVGPIGDNDAVTAKIRERSEETIDTTSGNDICLWNAEHWCNFASGGEFMGDLRSPL